MVVGVEPWRARARDYRRRLTSAATVLSRIFGRYTRISPARGWWCLPCRLPPSGADGGQRATAPLPSTPPQAYAGRTSTDNFVTDTY